MVAVRLRRSRFLVVNFSNKSMIGINISLSSAKNIFCMEVIKIRKVIRFLTLVSSLVSVVVFSLVIYGSSVLPDFIRTIGNNMNFSGIYSVTVSENSYLSDSTEVANFSSENTDIKLFGTIPVKKINVTKSDRKFLIPGGELVGIRLKTKGVLVVGTESFKSSGKDVSPAETAGINVGDSLIEIDGNKISSNKELAEIIAASMGNPMKMLICRNGENKELILQPEISDITGIYKGGLWIRDSTGGIGTLTYIDIEKGTFASLGHGIYDTDTNQLLPADSGELYSANLTGIKKGIAGNAGELKGVIGGNCYANINLNCDNGIFGSIFHINTDTQMIPVAVTDEIEIGKAQIISTVINDTKDYYDIEIEKINLNAENKNMVIKVTDDKLLETTGGIIQGMSGSPIIQNGMIIGAVTHVFLNDPTKGYGIFIDNMLDSAA